MVQVLLSKHSLESLSALEGAERGPATRIQGPAEVLSDDVSAVIIGDSLSSLPTDGQELKQWLKRNHDTLERLRVGIRFLQPSFEAVFAADDSSDLGVVIETLVDVYSQGNQSHLLSPENWGALDSKAKYAFLRELRAKDALGHAARFRAVMAQSSQAPENVAPVPTELVTDLDFCGKAFFRVDGEGKRVLSQDKVAFILVAGGLGERLGSTQIKISLPTESLTGKSFLDLFLRHLDSFASSSQTPLCIMTSDDTHTGTMKLLDSMKRSYSVGKCVAGTPITLCKQETVPCFSDKSGSIAVKTPGKLLLKPHGHGDVHPLVHEACVEEWRKQGIEYVVFFQDTNPNCFRVLPSLIGVMAAEPSLDCAVACVPRVPGSATGCIATVQGGKTIENVEYNIMNVFLSKTPGLDEKFTLGNTNQMVLRMASYAATSPRMPEFCNPKYQPNSDSQFTSPARLECLMQDVMRFFPAAKVRPVLFRDFDLNKTKTHVLYAPAKNSLQVAQRAWDNHTSDGSPASSEAALYAGNCGLLIRLGCKVEADESTAIKFGTSMQISPLYPCVVFDPAVLPFWSDAPKDVFPDPSKVVIGANSTLEFRGPGRIVCKRLHLEGSLVVWAKTKGTTIVLEDVTVVNSGRSVSVVEGDARIQVKASSDVCVIESSEDGIKTVRIPAGDDKLDDQMKRHKCVLS